MDVKKVRLWVQQFKEGLMLCDRESKEPQPCSNRSDNMMAQVEHVVMEDRRLTLEEIASKVGVPIGSMHTILHEDLKMRNVSSRWVPRMLTKDHKAALLAMCQTVLTYDDNMNVPSFH